MPPLTKNVKLFATNKLFAAMTISVCLSASQIQAAPEGGVIVGGSGSITTAVNTTNISQQTHSMAIDWSSFNVGSQEVVNFIQPSSSATALNRIGDQNPSQIFGSINANGRVFLSNPNGWIFGKTAKVNVNTLFTTSLDISSNDFMQGNFLFKADGYTPGAIINNGLLTAASGGSINLVGGQVNNKGYIIADYGHINLATGKQAIVNFDGDGLINFQVSGDVLTNPDNAESSINNEGDLQANGGQIVLDAHVAKDVFTNAINNDGVITAHRIENYGGEIYLRGNAGTTIHSGEIDASSEDGEGGSVFLLGDRVGLFGKASVDASGDTGGGTVLVGGDYQGKNHNVQNAVQTHVGEGATVKADATDSGDGGKVIVWADETTWFYGSLSASGGDVDGDGGFAEISGKENLVYRGDVDIAAPSGNAGSILFDPRNLTVSDGGQTDLIGANDTDSVITKYGFTEGDAVAPSDDMIDATAITDITNTGVDVILQANQDILISEDITTNNVAGDGGSITLQAGRSITISANVTTDNGDFNATANDTIASGVVDGERGAGDATISITDGFTINTGTANISLTIAADAIKTNHAGGDITLENLIAAQILVENNDSADTGTADILRASSDALLSATGIALQSSEAGSSIGLTLSPIRITTTNLEAATAGGAFFDSIGGGMNIGGATLGALTGITTTASGNLEITSAGSITQNESLTIGGTGSFTTSTDDQVITLDNTSNAISGEVDFTTNTSAVAGSGAGHVTFDNGTLDVVFGASTIDGDLNVTSGNASGISDNGIVTVDADVSLTTDANAGDVNMNQLAQTELVSNSLSLNTHTTGSASIVNASGINLNSSTIGGTFDVIATTGDISQTGAVSVTGTSTLTTATDASDIILNHVSNAFTSEVTFKAGTGGGLTFNDITFVNSGGIKIDNNANANGDFFINADTNGSVSNNLSVRATTGNITDNITVVVGGDAAFITSANEATINLGTLAVTGDISLTTNSATSGGAATIINATGISFGLSSVVGNLDATATTGDITQTGTLTVAGTSLFNTKVTNSDIILGLANNFASHVTLQADNGSELFNHITFVDNGGVRLHTSGSIDGDLFINAGTGGAVGGDLNVTSTTGSITQGVALTVGGTSSFTTLADDQAITLNMANAITGEVDFTTNTSALAGAGTGHVTFDNGTNDIVFGASTIDGDLIVTSGDVLGISDNGIVTVDADVSLTTDANAGVINMDQLAQTELLGNTLLLNTHSTGTATIVNATGINLATNTGVGGATSLTATAGNIIDSGTFTVSAGGTTFITSTNDADINVDSLAVTGNITLTTNSATTGANATIVNATSINFATSIVDGNLSATATTGTITQSGTLTVAGTGSFITVEDDQVITLGNANAITGEVDFTTNTSAVPGSGAGHVTFDNGTLDVVFGASTVDGNLVVTSGNVLGITDNGIVTVDADVSLTTDANAGVINMDQLAQTELIGNTLLLNTHTTGTATIVNATGINLATNTGVGGATSLTATAGNIIDSGTFTVSAGGATFVTSTNDADINVDSLAVTGNITLTTNSATTGGSATIINATGVSLAASTVDGDLSVTATTGNISQTGALVVAGTSLFSTVVTGSNIILDQSNNFTGQVTLRADDGTALAFGDITFVDNSSIHVNSSASAAGDLFIDAGTDGDVGGTLNLTSTSGTITQAVALTVGGTASFTALADDQAITLSAANAITGEVDFSTNTSAVPGSGAGHVSFDNGTLDVVLGTSTIDGNLIVVSGAAAGITDNGIVTVDADVSLTTDANAGVINMDQLAQTELIGNTLLLNTHTTGTATIVNATGINLAANTGVGGATSLTATAGNIIDSGTFTVSAGGATFVTSTNDADINVDSLAVTGNIALTTNSATTGGSATIINATGVSLAASTVDGDLSVTATTGNISQTGALVVAGTSLFSTVVTGSNIILDQSNNFTGQVTLRADDGTALAFGDITFVDNSSIHVNSSASAAGDLFIDAGTDGDVGGTLNLTSTSGTITQAVALTVGGTASFTALADDQAITLSAANAITGEVDFSTNTSAVPGSGAGHVSFDNGTLDVVLGTSTIDGNLIVVSGAAAGITDNGIVTVDADVSLTTDANAGVINMDQLAQTELIGNTLLLNTHTTGTATIVNATGINLAANTGVGGATSLTATAGNIIDSGTFTVSAGGATFITSTNDADINVDSLAVTGNITLTTNSATTGANATIVNATGINFATSTVDGNLSATATTGTITQSGTLTVAGTGSFITVEDDQVITLGSANAITGEVDFTTNTSAVPGSGAGHVTFDNGLLDVVFGTSTIDGNLVVTSGNVLGITDNGIVTVDADVSLTTDANAGVINMNQLAQTELAGNTLLLNTHTTGTATIVNAGGINLAANTGVGGASSLTATTGNIIDSGTFTVSAGGASFITSANDADIILGTLAVTGNISLTTNSATTGATATIVNATGINFSTSTVDGNLDVTATTGTITQSGALTVAGTGSFSTLQNDQVITLGSANAISGEVDFTTNTAAAAGSGAGHVTFDNGLLDVVFGASTIDGNLVVTSGNALGITDNGIVTVDADVSLTTDANAGVINMDQLAQTELIGNTLLLNTHSTGGATIVNTTGINFGISSIGGGLVVTASTGAIMQSGIITAGGTGSFTTLANDQVITLNLANAIAGEVDFSTNTVGATGAGTGHVSFDNGTLDVVLGTSTIDGNLIVVSGAAAGITDNGIVTVDADVSLTTDANAGVINMDQLAQTELIGNTLLLNTHTTGTATIVNATGINLAANTGVGGATSLTATAGNIIDSGTFTVSAGGATFITSTNDADINVDSLAVTGNITLTTNSATTGANATIVNATGINFATSTVDGNLSATATTGTITQSGTLTVAGTGSFITVEDDQVITLGSANAITGEVDFTTNTSAVPGSGAGHVTFDNGLLDVVFGTSTIDGNLVVTSGNVLGITDNGIVTVDADVSLTTDANAGVINMNQLAQTELAGNTLLLNTHTTGTATIVNAGGINLAANTGVGGASSLTATTGNIIDSGTFTVSAGGASFITSANDADIILGTLAVTGNISLTTNSATTGATATIVNATGINFSTSTVDGNLDVTATTGTITQSGALTVAGTGSFSTLQNDQVITLGSANAISGEVDFTTNTAAAAGSGAGHVTFDNGLLDVVFGASTIDGNLVVTSGNALGITDNGIVTVDADVSLTTDANAGVINMDQLAQTELIGNTLLLNTHTTGTATIVNATGINLATNTGVGGATSLTATVGNIIDSGTFTVSAGGATFVSSANDADIILGTLAVTGDISLTTNSASTGGTATIVNATGISFGTSIIDGNLSATATTGAITQSGIITASGLITSSTAGTTLNSANVVGTFDASNSTTGNINFTNASATTLTIAGISQTAAASDVTISNNGPVATSGTMTSTGDLTINSNAANGHIVLSNAITNAVNVNLTASGTTSNIELNAGAITTITASGTVTLSATGDHLDLIGDDNNIDVAANTIDITAGVNVGRTSSDALNLNVTTNLITVSNNVFTSNGSTLTYQKIDAGNAIVETFATDTNVIGTVQGASVSLTVTGGNSLTIEAGNDIIATAGDITLDVGTGSLIFENDDASGGADPIMITATGGDVNLIGDRMVLDLVLVGTLTPAVISGTNVNVSTSTTSIPFIIGSALLTTTDPVSPNGLNWNATELTMLNTTSGLGTVIFNAGSGTVNFGSTTAAMSEHFTITTTGNIEDTTGTSQALSLGAGKILTLNAGAGIGAGNAISFTADNASAVNTTTGVINLAPTGTTTFDVITQSATAAVTITSGASIVLNNNVSASSNAVNLTTTNGSIGQTGGVITNGLLTTNSKTGTVLNQANVVGTLNASNTTSGDITFNNTSGGTLVVTGINQSGVGNVVITESDTLSVTGAVVTTGGTFSSTSATFDNTGGTITSNDGAVTINSSGSSIIGSTIDAGAGSITINIDTDTSGIDTLTILSALTSSLSRDLNGNGDDSLIGNTAVNTFVTNAANAGTLDGINFAGFSTLKGGAGIDVFDITAVFAGSVDGEADGATLQGTQIIDTVITGPSGTIGVSGTNAALSGFSNITTITGTGAGTLTGSDNTSVWALGVSSSYTDASGVANFSAFTNLTGGAGMDTFNLASGATLAGSLDGGAGTSDTLTKVDGTNAWTVTGDNSGTVPGVGGTFSNIENLTGGSGADNFVFSDGVVVNGTVVGGGGNDTLDLSAYSTTNNWNITDNDVGNVNTGAIDFSDIDNLTGGSSTDNFVFTDAKTISGTVNGGGGTDTLDLGAYTTANNWNITDNDLGNVNTGAIDFNDIDNLTGGSSTDNFVFADSKAMSGIVSGGSAGTDTLDYSAYTTAAVVDLALNTATASGGISGIDNLIGGTGSDTLSASNVANIWNITDNDIGNIDGNFFFSSVENLTGGSATDNFVFTNAKSISGIVSGGSAGIDTLNYNSYSTTVSVNLQTGVATATSSFTGIENFVGNGANATLIGSASNEVFIIDAVNAGNIDSNTIVFSGFANVDGGNGTDSIDYIDANFTNPDFSKTGGTVILGFSGTYTSDDPSSMTYAGMETATHAGLTSFSLSLDMEEFASAILDLRLDGAGTNIVVSDDGSSTVFYTDALSNVLKLTINGGTGDDALTVDFTNGTPFNTTEGLTFNGGTAGEVLGDRLTLVNATGLTTITHNLLNATDGNIDIDSAVIAYTGVDPVIDTLVASNRVFNFAGGAETISIGDTGGSDGISLIDSTLGAAISFTDPTASLTVNAGSDNDIVQFNTLDAAWDADITINGGAGVDAVNLLSAVNAGATRVINITSDTIDGSASASADLIAINIDLNAVNGIGVSTALGTSSSTLSADTTNGNIDINSFATASVVISTMSTGTGNIVFDQTGNQSLLLTDVDTANGSITVVSDATITAADIASLTDSDANDISLTATGATSDVLVTTITAGASGDVTLVSGDDVLDTNSSDANLITADVLTVTANNATVDATNVIDLDTTVSSADLTVSANVGSINIDETDAIVLSDVDTFDGAITVIADGLITATDVASLADKDVNDISLTTNAGDISVGLITAGTAGDVTLNANAAITDGDATTDVTTDTLTVVAGGGISLDTDAVTLVLQSTATGSIDIQEANDVTLTNASNEDGDITIEALGDLFLPAGFTTSTTTSGDINFISNSGNAAAIISGAGQFTVTSAGGFTYNNPLEIAGAVSITTGTPLNITEGITTSVGSITLDSSAVSFSGVAMTSASTININNAVVTANGDLTLNAQGINLANAVTMNNGDLTLNTGAGELSINNIVTINNGDLTINAADLNILAGSIVGSDTVTISDTGNGMELGGTASPGKLNISLSEYDLITAASLILSTQNDLTLKSSYQANVSTAPLTINANQMNVTQAGTTFGLLGNLDLVDTPVNASADFTVNTGGTFAMNNTIVTNGAFTLNAGQGVNMGEPSSITSTNNLITMTSTAGDILLGLTDAGTANVNLTATAGSVLNNNGVFINIGDSKNNIKAFSTNINANQRIGVSSTDAVTIDASPSGVITLAFDATKAFINNLQSTTIVNNGTGEVAVGLVFSGQITGVGHNVGVNPQANVQTPQEQVSAKSFISILGAAYNEFDINNEEEDSSTLNTVVPVMIRTKDGWEFKAPVRKHDNKKGQERKVDWL